MTNAGQWTWKAFDELSPQELYDALQLRAAIFVVEQNCAYLDLDGLDPVAIHCFCHEDGRLIAYQRCLGPGTAFDESSIGRIIVDPSQRGRALGRELVQRGIDYNLRSWPDHPIRIGAQAHLAHFYGSLGFVSENDHYLEDGIEHVHMRLAR
ncbi:MAG: GNAT family N-acetyltransferase [Halieaceae bacterium]|nr:GNAT family N-acetyltransferase [Halieaceae bacterium]